jgi:predicted Zn-dependent peptidase
VADTYQLSTLSNGLRVVSERLDGVRSVALGVWIDSGSRAEPDELAGISHLIEHMLFKGTADYSAIDIARIFDEMGGEPNAATSKEHTLVHARLLDDDLEQAFAVIADMVQHPTMADLDAEREVVLEEVAMYEDSPPELIHDYLTEAVFQHHPLGRAVIGTTRTLRSIDEAAVKTYHQVHYVPSAIVIAAAGHVDHAQLVRLAERHFGGTSSDVPAPQAPLSPAGWRHVALFSAKETEQYHVCLGGPGPRRADEDRWPVYIIDTLLGGSWSSRLFQEVRDKRGLAYSVYSYTSMYADSGLTAIYFGSREEAVGEAMRLIVDELKQAQNGFGGEDVARAKKHVKGSYVLSMESPSSRMQSLGRNILSGLPVLSVDEVLARVDAVTPDEIAQAAAAYYDIEKWSTVCIGPRPEPWRAVTGDFTWEEW